MYIMLYSIYYLMNAYTIYNLHICKCICSILAFYVYSIILYVQCIYTLFIVYMGFPGGASCKEPACQCRRHQILHLILAKRPRSDAGDIRDEGSIPGQGRSLGEENGNPPWYLCLENHMDREA